MRKNLRTWISVFAIALMAVMATGCGNDNKPSATESANTETATPVAEETQQTQDAEKPESENTEAKGGSESAGLRLVGGEALLAGTTNQIDEKNDDGSYYSQDMNPDGSLVVYQQGGIALPDGEVTMEEYAMNIATGLSDTGANDDARVKESNDYSANVSYPVYVASFTSGGNEDTRQWWVFVTYTDSSAYLYGISTPADAEPDAGTLADETFPNLRIG